MPSVAAPITSRSPLTPGPSASAARNAAAWGAGRALDVLEHGAQQLEQAGERNRRLALDAARRQHAHPAGRCCGVGEQRRSCRSPARR